MTTAEKIRKQGMQQGIQQGIKQGKEEGAKENAVKSALKMLKAGLAENEIIDFTELSETEMKMLKAFFAKLGVITIDIQLVICIFFQQS